MLNQAAHQHLAANRPDTSTSHGVMDGNKTFPSVARDSTGRRYKRETHLKFSEGTVEQYESFRSQFIIHHKMLRRNTDRAGTELYMSLEGKAALKVEEVILNAKGMSVFTRMWDTLDRAFLPIDHRESRYKQFATRCWRTGERMTEYMDKLICLFRKARPDSSIDIINEEVKNHLLEGLPSNVMEVIKGYLDLSADDIARKYNRQSMRNPRFIGSSSRRETFVIVTRQTNWKRLYGRLQ